MHKPTGDHSKRDFSTYFKALDNKIHLEDYVVTMLCKELFISGEKDDFKLLRMLLKIFSLMRTEATTLYRI